MNKKNNDIILILPLIIIIGLVPLIVRLKLVPNSEAIVSLGVGEINTDFFSYYKMVWFLVFTGFAVTIPAIRYFTGENIGIKRTNIYIPMAIYILFATLSTLFAIHSDIAKLGYADRYEGIYVLLAYMICLFLAINLINEEKQIKAILYSLGISSVIISIIGIFQFLGKDLFASNFGRKLIVPSIYPEIRENLNFTFGESNTIYGTLFNPNYVGVYMAMIFPLGFTIMLLSKDRSTKIFFGIVSLLSFITLLGSGSRTGIISILLYIILALIFFRKNISKKWKPILGIFAIMILLICGVNYYTEGLLKARVLNIKYSFEPMADSNFKDILLEDNRAKIILEDYELNIEYNNGNLYFSDENGDTIESTMVENKITFDRAPYDQHAIILSTYEDNLALMMNILSNRGWANFNLIIEDENIKFLNARGEATDIEIAPSWGFRGRETFASGRGYIWSRSIPLLRDTLFIGYGPDTYALHFPQDDYIGRLQTNTDINLVVDKPHNYYLQTGINTGMISLLSIIAIFIMYLISGIKTYIKRDEYLDFIEIAGISIFFSVFNYLMIAFLNDSAISVAPVFWILLGTGFSISMNLKNTN